MGDTVDEHLAARRRCRWRPVQLQYRHHHVRLRATCTASRLVRARARVQSASARTSDARGASASAAAGCNGLANAEDTVSTRPQQQHTPGGHLQATVSDCHRLKVRYVSRNSPCADGRPSLPSAGAAFDARPCGQGLTMLANTHNTAPSWRHGAGRAYGVPRDDAARMEGVWKEVTPPAWQTAIRHAEHGDYEDHQEWTPRLRLQPQLVHPSWPRRELPGLQQQLTQAVSLVGTCTPRCDPASVLCTQPCPPAGNAWSAGDQLKLGGGVTASVRRRSWGCSPERLESSSWRRP